MPKPTFKLSYTFEGYGTVEIAAKSLDEAVDKFYDGDFSDEKEDGQNYVITDEEVME